MYMKYGVQSFYPNKLSNIDNSLFWKSRSQGGMNEARECFAICDCALSSLQCGWPKVLLQRAGPKPFVVSSLRLSSSQLKSLSTFEKSWLSSLDWAVHPALLWTEFVHRAHHFLLTSFAIELNPWLGALALRSGLEKGERKAVAVCCLSQSCEMVLDETTTRQVSGTCLNTWQ